MKRITLFWKNLPNTGWIHNMQECLGIPQGMSLNGEQFVEVTEEQEALINKYVEQGLIEIRHKETVKINGQLQQLLPGALKKLLNHYTIENMNEFENVIKKHLDTMAASDEAFSKKYVAGQKSGKTIETCCNFICQEVKKTGRNGWADAEIYGMAIHYYDEDSINPVTAKNNCRIVTPSDEQNVELSAEEMAEAKEQAKREVIDQFREMELQKARNQRARKAAAAKTETAADMPSLFD